MGAHEAVVAQLRVGGADPVDLLLLAWPEALVRVEAPDAVEQALPAENVVAAGDHAVEIVDRVENRGVAVGDLRFEREQIGRDTVCGIDGMDAGKQVRKAASALGEYSLSRRSPSPWFLWSARASSGAAYSKCSK